MTERTDGGTVPQAGVGGWLALLVIGMTVLGPLLFVVSTAGEFSQAERLQPNLQSVEGWAGFKGATWALVGLSVLTSIYGGVGLFCGRHWSYVKRAITALWVSGPLTRLIAVGILPGIFFGGVSAEPADWAGVLRPILPVAVWTACLLRSRRVSILYPRPPPLP